MNLEDIKKNYANFDDSKIANLAKYEAKSLRPEVVPLLIDEIRRRNLPENLIQGIETQLKVPTLEEINTYCNLINSLSCPDCDSNSKKLNGIIVTEVISMILLTNVRKNQKIACPDCLEKHKNNANSKTAFLGWWGFPWGIIRTIQALITNSKMSNQIWDNQPNDILKSFVLENIGAIETNKDNATGLKALLKHSNNNSN